MPLTPEEQAELNELQAREPQGAILPEIDPSQLSPEEQIEYNALLERSGTNEPTGSFGSDNFAGRDVVNSAHPLFSVADRLIVKNLMDQGDPDLAVKFLRRRYPGPAYDIRLNEATGEVIARQAGETDYRKLEETGFPTSWSEAGLDVLDIGGDIATGLGESAAMGAGFAAGGIPGAVAAGAAAGGGLSALRQSIASALGEGGAPRMQDVNLTQAAIDAALVPAAGALTGFGPAASKGALGELGAKIAPHLAETTTGIKAPYVRKAYDILDEITPEAGMLDKVEQTREGVKATIGSARRTAGEKLNESYEEIGVQIDTRGILAPFIALRQKLERRLAETPNDVVLQERYETLDRYINNRFKDYPGKISGVTAEDLMRELKADAGHYKIRGGTVGHLTGQPVETQQMGLAANEAYHSIREQLDEIPEAANVRKYRDEYRSLAQAAETLDKYTTSAEHTEKNLKAALRKDGVALEKLKKIDKEYGTNIVDRAEELYAYELFANPNLFPMSAGGTTSTTRSLFTGAIGGGLGGAAGAALGEQISPSLAPYGQYIGGGIGAGAASILGGPRAVKQYMRGLKLLDKAKGAGAVGVRPTQQAILVGSEISETPESVWEFLREQQMLMNEYPPLPPEFERRR